jgi:membrane protease YdiL (CAAX protease family)
VTAGAERPDEDARTAARLVGWIGFVVAFAALSYAGNLSDDGDTVDEPLYSSSFFVASLVGFGLMVAVALILTIGASRRELFALRAPSRWGAALGWSFLVLVATFVVSGVVGLFLDPGAEQGLLPEEWPPPDVGVFALNVAAVVIGAPLAEELMFRGLGYSLLERFGPAFAIGGSAVAWGLAHGLIEAFPVIVALGIGLGFLRRKTGSIVPGMVLHGIFNALAVLAAALSAGEA